VTKRYAHTANYTDLPEITLQQIQHFFEHYKDLESGKWVKVAKLGRRDRSQDNDNGSD
jgi:inorganic pyrophosphatase